MINTYQLGLSQHIDKLLSKEANTNYSEILALRTGIICNSKENTYNHSIPLLLLITNSYCENFERSYVPCDYTPEMLPIFSFNVTATCGMNTVIDINRIVKQVNPIDNNYKIKIKTNPSHGTVIIENGNIIYKSVSGYNDMDSFSFYLTKDEKPISSVANVSVNVKCCEPLPPGFATVCVL